MEHAKELAKRFLGCEVTGLKAVLYWPSKFESTNRQSLNKSRHHTFVKNRTTFVVTALLITLFNGCSKPPAQSGWSPSSTITLHSSVPIDALHSGMTVQDIIVALGQPSRTNAAGLEFSSVGLFIVPHKGEFTLFPPFAGRTVEGIGMSSSRADVIRAYGTPSTVKITKPGYELLRYSSLRLSFQLHDGRVDWIDAFTQ